MTTENITPLFCNLKNKQPSDSQILYKKMEEDTLARTIWGEARGETIVGMQAVACVILNRHKISKKLGSYWWGNDIINICQKPYQFSCWNRSDPNYKKLMDVTEKDIIFSDAKRISKRAISGTLTDITDGSTHYHAKGINPFWAKNEKYIRTIGNHIFYKLIE